MFDFFWNVFMKRYKKVFFICIFLNVVTFFMEDYE